MMRQWAITDRGCVRGENQDACAVRRYSGEDGQEQLAALVCDGMGGAKAGNVASRMAVEQILSALAEKQVPLAQAQSVLEDAIRQANHSVYNKSRSEEAFSGMGTTLVALLTDGSSAMIANIGDSRCYLIREKEIRQITKDHSLVQDLVDRGEIDRAEAWLHPQRNYITRALGTELSILCDFFFEPLQPGDVLLLCSDGLSGIVNPQELLYEIAYGPELDTAVERLLEIAMKRGAPDNVTAVLLAVEDESAADS